jgi:hypothetical protein
MTTLLTPQGPGVASARPRLLSISANLLPPETIEARTTRKIRRIVLASLGVFTLLLGGWIGIASITVTAARNDLIQAQDDVTRVKQQERAYGELTRTQAESKSIENQLSKLFASNVQLSQLLSALEQAAATNKISLTGASTSLGAVKLSTPGAGAAGAGAPGAGAPGAGAAGAGAPGAGATGAGAAGAVAAGAAGAGTPAATAANGIGSVSLTGTAPTKVAIASYLDALVATAGVENATLADVMVNEAKTFDFTLRLDIGKDAIGGRFGPGGGK